MSGLNGVNFPPFLQLDWELMERLQWKMACWWHCRRLPKMVRNSPVNIFFSTDPTEVVVLRDIHWNRDRFEEWNFLPRWKISFSSYNHLPGQINGKLLWPTETNFVTQPFLFFLSHFHPNFVPISQKERAKYASKRLASGSHKKPCLIEHTNNNTTSTSSGYKIVDIAELAAIISYATSASGITSLIKRP